MTVAIIAQAILASLLASAMAATLVSKINRFQNQTRSQRGVAGIDSILKW
jgi:hypothetical protein